MAQDGYHLCRAISGQQEWTYHSPFIDFESVLDVAPYAIAFKWEPVNKSDVALRGMYVKAKVCSNPIYNLNNLKEMTWTTDTNTGLITGLIDYSQWNYVEHLRLQTRCFLDNITDIGMLPRDLSRVIYETPCGSGAGMLMHPDGVCKMFGSHHEHANPPMELYLGFDATLSAFCVNDDNGNYTLSTLNLSGGHTSMNPSIDPSYPHITPSEIIAATSPSHIDQSAAVDNDVNDERVLYALVIGSIAGVLWMKYQSKQKMLYRRIWIPNGAHRPQSTIQILVNKI
eukprot:167707_1